MIENRASESVVEAGEIWIRQLYWPIDALLPIGCPTNDTTPQAPQSGGEE